MGFLDDIPAINNGHKQRQKRQADQRQQRSKNPPAGPLNLDGERVVYWRVIRCPYCNSRNCPRYSTDPIIDNENIRIRRHKCDDCGKSFKSIEEI